MPDPIVAPARGGYFHRGMSFVFPRWSDTAFRVGLVGIAVAIPGVFVIPLVYVRTPYNLDRQAPIDQPVQFDHRHHAQDDEIACLYCHSGAERTPFAGVPATELCMGCHSQIWSGSPMLEQVRRSYFSGQPIAWNRVHRVPDFVFFNHAVHVSAGKIDCVECHGDVRREPLVERARLFTMGWCLDCHRARSIDAPFGPTPGAAPTAVPAMMASNDIGGQVPPPAPNQPPRLEPQARLTTCSTCHR